MDLAYEFTYDAILAPKVPVGDGPFGRRHVPEVTDGKVTGDSISRTVGTGGRDWVLVGPDGWGRVDVGLQIPTDDGPDTYGRGGLTTRNSTAVLATR